MSELWFNSLRALVETRTGVAIDEGKQYLAEARLTPLLSRFDKTSLPNLIGAATSEQQQDLTIAVIEAMMTGETFFFRDMALFQEIKNTILPDLIEKRAQTKKLRIWSAACSTGQEAYSLAMIFDELANSLCGWDVEIWATDVSNTALERARSGIYNQFEVQRGLPVTHLLAHFERYEDHWRISRKLRSLISFQPGSLMTIYLESNPFDLILCRNVLMYFRQEARTKALSNVDQHLAQDGHLIVGTSESGIAKCLNLANKPEFPAILHKQPAISNDETATRFNDRSMAG